MINVAVSMFLLGYLAGANTFDTGTCYSTSWNNTVNL